MKKLLVIILLVIACGAGYFYYQHFNNQTNMNKNNSEQTTMEAVYLQYRAVLQDQHKTHTLNDQDFEKFKGLSYFPPSLTQEQVKDLYSFTVADLQSDDPIAQDLKFLEIRNVPANILYLADKVYIGTYELANPEPEFKGYTGLEFILFKNVDGSWRVAGDYPTQYKNTSEIEGLLKGYCDTLITRE